MPHLLVPPPVNFMTMPYSIGLGRYPKRLFIICAKLAAIGLNYFLTEEIRIPVKGGIKQAPKNRQSQRRATK